MSIASRFSFVGEVIIPQDKERYIREWTSEDGKYQMCSINFGIKDDTGSREYVELFGILGKVIKTKDSDNNNIEFPAEDRFNDDIVSTVAGYRKNIVALDPDNRKEFVTSYDAALYLADELLKYEGKVMVTGRHRMSPSKGRFYSHYEVGNVFAVSPETKSKLTLKMDFFYNGDSIDKADFKESKRIYVNGYTSHYINKEVGEKYIPQTAILSAEKYDMDNERHAAKWKYKTSYIDKLSKKKMYHIVWECRVVNGVEELEFDESMLTDKQREQVELGIRTLNDFKPRGAIVGEKIKELRLFDPVLIGDFEDGLVECEETLSEFEDNIYVFEAPEKVSDIIKESNDTAEDEDDDDDLF